MASASSCFHLTLPSNASMDIFPDNTAAQYVTKLPRRMELDDGEWNVCLREISTPLAFVNVPAGTCSFVAKNDEREHEITVEGGLYVGEALAYEVDRLSEPYDIQCRLQRKKKPPRKVKITVGDTHVFRPNKRLSTMLGLAPEQREYARGVHLAETGLKVPVTYDISNLYVYCDIVEHVVVCDVTAPLLCIVECKPNARRARMHMTFDTPILVPVQKRSFDTI